MYQKQIVSAINFIKMRALITKIDISFLFYYHSIQSTLFRCSKFLVEFRQMNPIHSPYNISSSVIIKQKRIMMIHTFHIMFFPWSGYLICGKQIRFSNIIGRKAHIKFILMISKACCPHPFSIDALLSLKALCICTFKSVKNIRCKFPMYEII